LREGINDPNARDPGLSPNCAKLNVLGEELPGRSKLRELDGHGGGFKGLSVAFCSKLVGSSDKAGKGVSAAQVAEGLEHSPSIESKGHLNRACWLGAFRRYNSSLKRILTLAVGYADRNEKEQTRQKG
jgi:hypothetical protein